MENFVKPHYISQIKQEGLSATDLANSLGIPKNDIQKIIKKNDLENVLNRMNLTVEKDLNSEEYLFSTNAAVAFCRAL